MVIYKEYNSNYPIQQGDIFRNIPYFSFDLLLRAENKREKVVRDDTEEIINEIILKGNPILVETFIASTFCILASQDCDIENNKDLIFLLLEELKANEIKGYKDIDQALNKGTRTLYLPKIKIGDRTYGPFKVHFAEPIKIPTILIKEKLKEIRVAKIYDSAKKVFISKMKNFYARFAINQIIFYENEDIQNYIIDIWKKEDLTDNNKTEKIEEIKLILESIERISDLGRIYFRRPIDSKFIEENRKKIIDLNFEQEDSELVHICDDFLKSSEKTFKSLNNQQHLYELLLNRLYFDEDSLIIEIESEDWKKNFAEKLSTIEEGSFLKIRAESAREYFIDKYRNKYQDEINT